MLNALLKININTRVGRRGFELCIALITEQLTPSVDLEPQCTFQVKVIWNLIYEIERAVFHRQLHFSHTL